MNWIFVGASTIASEHMVDAVRSTSGHEIKWLVSGVEDHGKAWSDMHEVPNFTTDYAEALAVQDASVVYISSTNEKHHDQAMAAIAAGKHVLCEKPLAMTRLQATEMVDSARSAKVVLATNHHLRCSGSHRAVKDLITSGCVGDILSMRVHHAVSLPANLRGWRVNDECFGGGVISDISVHDADVVRFLLGEDPVSVVAQKASSPMSSGVEDSVMSVLAMPSGVMVLAHESFTHPFAGSALEVHGNKGSIFGRGIMTQNPTGTVELVTCEGTKTVAYEAYSLYQQCVAEFVGAISGQGRPAADGVDGSKSLAVAQAIREAADSGTRVYVDYGDQS